MTARILIVDDVETNLKLLEARLVAEYYEVVTARTGRDAIAICLDGKIDLVLLDVMMPGMDGFEVCETLKADPATTHIPIVMITALGHPAERIRGLEAGADDLLTKPVNHLQLIARVGSLARLKALTDELHLRAETTHDISIEQLLERKAEDADEMPSVLVVDESAQALECIEAKLHGHFLVTGVQPTDALAKAAEGAFECIMIATSFSDYDPLRLCAQLKAMERTRRIPILLLASEGEEEQIIRGLELAVNDYLLRPFERQELIARLRTQIRRKRYNDSLRSTVARTVEMAVTDPLTGLHNRRYLDMHLERLMDRALKQGRPLSILIADIDNFKAVNDNWGHDFGDLVLKEFAELLRRKLRGIDLVCRYGGEEFVIVMPDTELKPAQRVAERICNELAEKSFSRPDEEGALKITTSVGISTLRHPLDTTDALMRRADQALYKAKTGGRNRVAAPAA